MSAFGAVGVQALSHVNSVADEAVSKATLIEVCEKSNNGLRAGLREYFESEIKKNEQLDVFKKFFPNVPPDQLRAALKDQNKRLEYNVNVRFADLQCKKVYE